MRWGGGARDGERGGGERETETNRQIDKDKNRDRDIDTDRQTETEKQTVRQPGRLCLGKREGDSDRQVPEFVPVSFVHFEVVCTPFQDR